SLIGFAVSAQFDPLDPLPTVPVTEAPPEAVGSTTTSTPAASSTTSDTAPSNSSSTTAAPAAASLAVSTETLDFGGDGTVNQFEITNTGGQTGTFEVAVSTDA